MKKQPHPAIRKHPMYYALIITVVLSILIQIVIKAIQ